MAIDLPDMDFDEQDVAETFDEDNTNVEEVRYSMREDAETLEELPDVYDATSAVGDDDDDAALIAEEMDDGDIVELESQSEQGDADLEDDDLFDREEETLALQNENEDYGDVDLEDPDDVDAVGQLAADEVGLEYAGDLNDREGAQSSARELESEALSDQDLRELDYKDQFTVDEDRMPKVDEGRSFQPKRTEMPAGGERGNSDLAANAAPAERDEDLHARQNELLDEGVEETFPASDPVSVKHIT